MNISRARRSTARPRTSATLIIVGKPQYAVFSAVAGERDVAPMLDGRNGTPKLEWIAALPGGGAAYRVVTAK